LVRDRCDTMDLAYAWHTGSVPQQKRREEINRFKNDPACRLFVSTDSGGVGLNLQVASAVVNLDLPWNPARLEQRIARAWRKFQKNSVSVINLVAENTLEHRMLATLAAKKGLADGVLDARGDLDSIEMPSGGAVFLQRLGQVMSADLAKPEPAGPDTAEAAAPLAATPQETVPPAELFRQELTVKLGDSLRLCKASCGTDQRVESAFVVVERDSEATREQVQRIWGQTHAGQMPAPVQVLDTRAFALLQQLRDAGLITINDRGMQELFKSDTFGAPSESDAEQRRKAAEPLLQQGERQAKMASVLQAGGFAIEAVAPMRKAVDWAGCALAVMCAAAPNTTAPEQFTPALIPVVCGKGAVSAESEDMLRQFGALAVADESAASQFLTRGGMLLAEARQHFVRLSL
jgi:hypothetical protein